MIDVHEAPHLLAAEDVVQLLHTSQDGLTSQEAEQRRKQFGPNSIQVSKRKPIWKIILKQFTHLMVYILLVAALISFLTGHYIDVYVILAIILINAAIGFVQEYKAEGAIAALAGLLVPKCKVIRNGSLQTVDATTLVPGDLVVLEEGDSVPADARVLTQKNARCTESSLTGEAVPVQKDHKALLEDAPLADRHNMVWKGTFLASGAIRAIVTGTGQKTQIGLIAESLITIVPAKTNFQNKTEKLAKQMAYIAIASAVVLFMVGYFFQEIPISELLLISIAALVSAIPEGLPAVLSLVLAIGSYRMSKDKAIIRETTATESLGSVSVIVTDKTGTLTQNTMTIQKVQRHGFGEVNVTGEGWESEGRLLGSAEDIEGLSDLLEIATHCHAAAIQKNEKGQFQVTGDPTEAAFLVLGNKAQLQKKLSIHEDLPFDSQLKYRTTLVEKEGKYSRFYLGAPEAILSICNTQGTKDENLQMLSESEKAKLVEAISSWSGEGLRVLAVAREQWNSSKSSEKIIWVGIAGMVDPPRPGVAEAVTACHNAGIRVIMATGDHAKTALAIAKKVNIARPGKEQVYTDSALQAMDDQELDKAVLEADVFSRLTPLNKLRIAQALQRQGALIAMTGDGVNDAPALKQANIGIAMGIMGTDVAKDASMMVLADDNFATIVKAIEQGRIVFNNARRTSFFLVTTNFAEILTLIIAVSMGMAMPLTATQILWINLVTDGFCDKALATERGRGYELKSPPIHPNENILNRSILPFLLINAVIMTVLAIFAFVYYQPEGIEKARTMVFITIAFSQLFNVFNMRNLKGSSFTVGLFSNKWVNYALIASVTIQIAIIEIPILAALFDFRPVPALEFLSWVALSSLVLWITEIYKWISFKHKN
jgi:P-type Ca2+ transporter type 2C